MADEAAWVKWFEEGEDEGTDSNIKPYGGYIGPPRPEGSEQLEDAHRDAYHARKDVEYARLHVECALADLNKCLAEVTRLTTEEKHVSSNR